ncbi:MAG: hypothetical protein AB1942_07455 [Pseudomonadota bacterium]
MNFRKILSLVAAFAAVATATAVVVVASSYGVYAVAERWLGPAGAAAVVAGVYALIAVVVAFLATRKAAPPKRAAGAPPADEAVVDRLISIAKERPIIALGAAAAATAAAVAVLVRNPALVTAVVSAFLAGNSSAKSGK